MPNKQLLPARKLRILTLGALTFAVPFAFVTYYVLLNPHMDFAYFYYAFQVVWQHLPVDQLYSMPTQKAWFLQQHFRIYPFNQFVYPPHFAVLLSWLASFGFATASHVWSFLDILGYLGGVWMVGALAHRNQGSFPRVIFYTTAILNFPFWYDLDVGNANWLVFFLLSAGLYLRYVRGLHWLAGVPLGLATVFKVTPVVFVLYLIIRKEWKTAAAAAATVVISTVGTVFMVGLEPVKFYVLHLTTLTATSMQNGGAPYNSSLLGVLESWQQDHVIHGSPASNQLLFQVFVGLLLLLVGWALIQSRHTYQNDVRPSTALGVLTVIIFSPLIEGTHLILAWITLWLLFGFWWDHNRIQHAARPGSPRFQTKSVLIALAFAWNWMLLSFPGWYLLPHYPSAYFYTLLVLFGLTLYLLINQLRIVGPKTLK